MSSEYVKVAFSLINRCLKVFHPSGDEWLTLNGDVWLAFQLLINSVL